MNDRVILHCDMNNFYASVECMKEPKLNSLPVAVCGDAEERHGIVLAKNYIAKSYGVKTAETIWQAKNKCPGLIIIPPDFREYLKISKKAMKIYQRYTDMVEPFGLDECWLDVTGSIRLFGSGEVIGHKIRESIKKELGLTVSVGVSFNKIFAKLGSDMKKPDALTVISRENFKDKVWSLPVGDLLGVGRKTGEKLVARGIRTIGQLAQFPESGAVDLLGKCGRDIWRHANGIDDGPVISKDFYLPDKSLGHGMTLRRDLVNSGEVWCTMLELCQDIGSRLYSYKKRAKGVSVSVKSSDMTSRQWQKQFNFGMQSPYLIAKEGFSLFESRYDWALPVRAVSVTAINLCNEEDDIQLDIFNFSNEKILKIDKAVERLRDRYGNTVIRNGCLVNNDVITNRDVLDGENSAFAHIKCKLRG